MAAPPRMVEPPFYDPPIVDFESGQQHSQAWTEYHQSVADRLAFVQSNRGIIDGSDAVAGQVGEFMTASATVALTNNATVDVVSLSLTAGDWDVAGAASFSAGGGTHAVFAAGLDTLTIYNQATFPTVAITQGISVPVKRYNVTAATTVWLVAMAGFSGTVNCTGTIRARRAR